MPNIKTNVHAVAATMIEQFNNNEDNVQEKSQASPEPYRCIMYTLYPDAEAIDGTDEFWDIVDAFVELSNK